MSKMKILFNDYKSQKEWSGVTKTHENIFRMGAQALSLNIEELVEKFFIETNESEWQLLTSEQQDQFIKLFKDWCAIEVLSWQ